MGIKVTESKKQPPKFNYPCLVQFSTGTVVLLTSKGTGTAVKSGKGTASTVGEHSDEWNTDYEPYEGSVTLTNE